MYVALIIFILLICFLLAVVVLAQNPKGGGLSSQFGAGGAANLMGVKRTGDLLEKLTWGFALGLMVLALATHMLGTGTAVPTRSINQQRAQQTAPSLPAVPARGLGAPPTPAATVPATPAPATAPATKQR